MKLLVDSSWDLLPLVNPGEMWLGGRGGGVAGGSSGGNNRDAVNAIVNS